MSVNSKQSLIVNIIILAAILVFVNLISLSFFYRLDLSKGKVYSLSKASKKIVGKLDDKLLVKAYFTENLPAEYADASRYVRDLLGEYQAYSKGKFKFEFIDPSSEEALKMEARKNMISPVQMRVIEDDQFVVREVYMGLQFNYRNKSEAIPFIQNTTGIEYEISSMIKRVTAIGLKKVAFFAPVDEEFQPVRRQNQQPITEPFESIKTMIAKDHELQETDLTQPIAPDVSALFITGVEDSLTNQQLFNLDQFMMNNGNLVILQDRMIGDVRNGIATEIKSNIFDLLQNYGINIKKNIVADAQCGKITLSQKQGMFVRNTPVSYPPFPIILQQDSDNVIVKNLEGIQLIYVSEIDTTRTNKELNFEPLLTTSQYSGTVIGPNYDISYSKYLQQNLKLMLNEGPKVVAGIYTGTIKSVYGQAQELVSGNGKTENKNTRILLLADGDFVKETGGAGIENNINLVLNSVDYMVSDDDLINIRSREVEFKPLKEISTSYKRTLKVVNIAAPSLLLLLIGLIIYRKESQKRKMIREMYE